MRSVINISLPEAMAKSVKKEVKDGSYGSTSEFFRHILRVWETNQLAEGLMNDRQEFEACKGQVLTSLKDLA